MDTAKAERVLVFFVCFYWIFFLCALLRLVVVLYDVKYKQVTKWTHAKTIHATIVAALLARAIHLTLMHFVDEGRNLFLSATHEDILFKNLASIPAHILITIYSLLGLFWVSILIHTYDSPMLLPKKFTLFGKAFDSSTTSKLKIHLNALCITFNVFLYTSWVVFLVLLVTIPDTNETYAIQSIFTSGTAIVLVVVYAVYLKRVHTYYQNNGTILSVEKLHVSTRVRWLVILVTVVFIIRLPLVLYISLSKDVSWITSFTFDLITFTLLEIIPFVVILILVGGKKFEEFGTEAAHFSFSYRKYAG